MVSRSNSVGQIINSPKPTNRITAAVRNTSGSESKARVIALSSNATIENDITKPSAIIAGRALLVWPIDAPSRIGSIGRVQGAATVTTPASSARTRFNITIVRREPAMPNAWAGGVMFFAREDQLLRLPYSDEVTSV